MRLTLRTLLAYLDDTLEPAQTKLIGEKVAATPEAQQLIERIKEVVRRRRLTTPPTSGPDAKTDANTVAEYIDSVLPPDQLAQVEEICLGSDVHLAEVAACHQILTVVLSEPVLVPPTAKRRMYSVVRGRESIPYRRPAATPVPAEPEFDGEESDETLLLGLPLYSRQGPWYRQLAPLGVVLVLFAALVAAILFSLRGLELKRPARPAAAPMAKANLETDSEEGVPSKNPAPVTAKATITAKAPAATEPVANAPPAPAKQPAADTKLARVSPPAPGAGRPATQVVPPPIVEPVQRQEQRPLSARFTPGKAHPSALLTKQGDASWRLVPEGQQVVPGQLLVSPPGCQSAITLDNGGQLLLWGSLPEPRPVMVLESMVALNNSADVDLDFTLVSGRIILSSRRAGSPYRARIRFQGEAWEVSLDQEGSEVFVELWGRPDTMIRTDTGTTPESGLGLVVLKGQATVKAGRETYAMREPPGRALYQWNNAGSASTRPDRLDEVPAWMARHALSDADTRVVKHLTDRLDQREDPRAAISSLLGERDEAVRRLAVLSLPALNDVPRLLEALGDERHHDVRVWAIIALRHWLARDANQAAQLKSVLEQRFGAKPAALVSELLHVYSAQQLREPGTWQALIAYLTNDKLAVRELADWQLRSLLPHIAQKLPAYDLAAGPAERRRIYGQWKRYVPDGKLPPPPPTSQSQPAPGGSGR